MTDDIIDPELMQDVLATAMGQPIEDLILDPPLELLVKLPGAANNVKVKVRYQPQSYGRSLAFDHGDPMPVPGTRRQKYDYFRTTDELLEKMNSLALKNIRVVNDIGKDGNPARDFAVSPGDIKISLIGPGEFSRLRDACFPPRSEEQTSGEDSGGKARSKGGKGVRGRESSEALAE